MQLGRMVLMALFPLQLFGQIGPAKTDARLETAAIVCSEGKSARVPLRSTDRLPEASGDARVERKGGTTEVHVELDSMKPASLFGGDYNTYVLWVVPPEGPAENVAEVLLDGSQSKTHASTSATVFAILITAEPHYLVTAPSVFVVLKNPPDSGGQAIEHALIEGVYNFNRSTLDNVKEAKGKVHTEIRQAFTAFRLAQRANANHLAEEEVAEAQRSLKQLMTLGHEEKDRTEIAAKARETIRLAMTAQRLAEDRAFQVTRVETEGSGGGKRGNR
jgi:hypothetical protein